MISSFWNLCRACPSMPVEKLHSEYRSTFQWHEYVGSHSDSVTQAPVVRQPSQSQQDQLSISAGRPEDPPFPRRKKHPELGNRSGNGSWLTKSSTAYEASLCPESRFTNISGSGGAGGSGGGGSGGGGGGGPRKSLSMGTIRSAGNIAPIHSPKLSLMPEYKRSAVDDTEPGMTTSAPEGMSAFQESKMSGGEAAYSSSYMPSQTADSAKFHVGKELEGTQEPRHDEFKKKEYKSEYKKRFRPFSQYEYVDGRFFKKKGDQEIENPWYKEVIELRKKAGEYKFRGWGTELGPQNIAQVYHQHVWDQVSRRTSLAALALITTTPKSISKEEKDKENAKKSYPGRPTHARPHTATPKHPISDLEKSKHLKDTDAVQPSKKKLLEETRIQNKSTSRVKEVKTTSPRPPPSHKPTFENKTNKLLREARSHSAGPGVGRSPRKAIRQQSAASSVSEKDNSSSAGGWKIHLDSTQAENAPTKPPQRHPRPTTLATSPRPKASSGKGDRDPNSKMAKQQQFDKSSADPYLGYNEPVVKSPPEPTRVKSPEQVILRSPDPVNWTVPLDTTKSFTVTQNIREAPPSPRFRAGEKLHGEIRNIHHPTSSTHHSSAGSTIASSPISSFSTRSAPVPLSTSSGQPGTVVPPKPITTSSAITTAAAAPTTTNTMTSSTSTPATTNVSSSLHGGSSTATTTTKHTSATPATTTSSLTEREHSSERGGGGGGGGGGTFRTGGGDGKSNISGAGPGTGGGISSASKPTATSTTTSASTTTTTNSQTPTKLVQKSSQQSHSSSASSHHPAAAAAAVNGFDEKAPAPGHKSHLRDSKNVPSSQSSVKSTIPPQPRMGSGAVRSKDAAKGTSSSVTTPASALTHTTASSTSAASASSASSTATSTTSDRGIRPGSGNYSSSSLASSTTAPASTASATAASAISAPQSSIPVVSDKPKPTNRASAGPAFKCLEDPTFSFDPPKPVVTGVSSGGKVPETFKGSIMSASTTTIPSRIPERPLMTSSTTNIGSKIPEVPKATSKFPEPPKSSSVIPTTTSSAAHSKIPEPHKAGLPGTTGMTSKIPEAPNKPTTGVAGASSTTIPSKLQDPIKPASSIPSKLPDPIKPLSTAIPSKLPDPIKPASPIISSKITTDPIRPSPPIPSRLSDPIKPPTSVPYIPSKLPEPQKSSFSSSYTSSASSASPSTTSKIPDPISGIKAGPSPTSSASKIPEPITNKPVSTISGKLPDIPLYSPAPGVHNSGIRPPSAGSSSKSNFRVLEAPPSPPILTDSLKRKDVFVPPPPVSAPKRTIGGISHVSDTPPLPSSTTTKASGYRVLEAPDDPNEPSVSVISPNSSRSRASDVLEKARHRFDKFWGGKSKDEEK